MNPGKLRHRITIQKPVEIKDDLNSPQIEWRDFTSCWASVEPISGREYILLQNTNSELTVRIKMRYISGITNGMRVKYGDRVFNIISPPIDLDERHRELHLMCSEVIASG